VDSILSYVVDLKKQIGVLISRHKNIEDENYILSSERVDLLKKIEVLEVEVRELKERVEIVDIAQGIVAQDSDSVGFARVRVNTLIRQIDKCIALLNE